MEALAALPDADISYHPGFLDAATGQRLFERLMREVPWRQDHIRLFGKRYPQPRLTALYGNNGKSYSYSGITMEPLPFTPELDALKKRLESFCRAEFSTCLLNLYRNGADSNGWHADNEKELGPNPVIASVSLGATRRFKLRHRKIREQRYSLELEPGSLLLMQGPTQHHWLHEIPKTRKPVGPRINLTFRKIY